MSPPDKLARPTCWVILALIQIYNIKFCNNIVNFVKYQFKDKNFIINIFTYGTNHN